MSWRGCCGTRKGFGSKSLHDRVRPIVAVGMPIAEHPPHRSGVRDSRTGLPPWVIDAEALIRPRMKDARERGLFDGPNVHSMATVIRTNEPRLPIMHTS